MSLPRWSASSIPVENIHDALYLAYQQFSATGRVLNVGVGADPVGFGDNVVHLDIDRWLHSWFVQADAHNLPFKGDAFDTVVMGDILEHLESPVQALREAHRVAPKLVITIFEEWRFGGVGQYIEKSLECFPTIGLEDAPALLERFPEGRCSHARHINQFDNETVENLLEEAGWRVTKMAKVPSGTHEGHVMWNWLITAVRRG